MDNTLQRLRAVCAATARLLFSMEPGHLFTYSLTYTFINTITCSL